MYPRVLSSPAVNSTIISICAYPHVLIFLSTELPQLEWLSPRVCLSSMLAAASEFLLWGFCCLSRRLCDFDRGARRMLCWCLSVLRSAGWVAYKTQNFPCRSTARQMPKSKLPTDLWLVRVHSCLVELVPSRCDLMWWEGWVSSLGTNL